MAKRRTRKDKIIAQLRRQVGNKTSPTPGESESKQKAIQQKQIRSNEALRQDFVSLFSYDPTFIRKDLVRTVIWASVAFGIEIGLYLLWR